MTTQVKSQRFQFCIISRWFGIKPKYPSQSVSVTFFQLVPYSRDMCTVFLDPSTDPCMIKLTQLFGEVPVLAPFFQTACAWVWGAHRVRIKMFFSLSYESKMASNYLYYYCCFIHPLLCLITSHVMRLVK